MKGFLALLIILLLGMSVYNWWEVQQLRQEIALLQTKVQEQQSGGVTDQVVAQATRAIAQAREAIAHTDMNTARSALETARERLASAGRTASEKAAPTVKWLEEQASDLTRKAQDKLHGR